MGFNIVYQFASFYSVYLTSINICQMEYTFVSGKYQKWLLAAFNCIKN